MRAVAAALMMMGVTACTTVNTGRDLVNTQRSPPRCGLPSYVVTASPLEYPKVLLDVIEERECNIEITDNYLSHSEMHVSGGVMEGVAIGLGALAGIGGAVALSRGSFVSPLPTATSTGDYRTAYEGDAAIILPFVGALAGLGAYYILGKNQTPIQTLPPVPESETRDEPHPQHTAIVDGPLRLRDGTAVGTLRGGQAIIDLRLAQRGFREGLYLDDHMLEWSVRMGAWTPAFSPACSRTMDAAESDSGIDKAPLGALARAAKDAASCSREGWSFAAQVSRWLEKVCHKRFDSSCESATK